MTCTNQYNIDISGCNETITIDIAETTADTDYILLLKYANESQKLIEVETDSSNNIIVTNDNMWHVGTGVLQAQLFAVGGCTPISFTVCDIVYDTFNLNFINIQQNDTNTTIPCPCA